MNRVARVFSGAGLLTLGLAMLVPAAGARAGTLDGVIDGVGPATEFNLVAGDGYVSTPDGGSIYTWGFGVDGMQYPGPTLIVNQGSSPVTVRLTNDLSVPVSIVFPAQQSEAVTGAPGLLTLEALPGQVAQYQFVPENPGTFMYHSGTEQDLQIEMGLFGAIIVRPAGASPGAYGHPSDADDYEREYLFLFSEMDPRIHELVEQGNMAWVDTSGNYDPLYWFINGRAAPDTMEMENVSWLPHQPYNCLPLMHPGQRLLQRYVGAGRQIHPQHPHGNHVRQIARDGRLLLDDDLEVAGPLVATPSVTPGQTMDFIFEWTGEGLGWDAYGTGAAGGEFVHDCVDIADNRTNASGPDGFDDSSWEWCADHGKPIPVALPNKQNVAFGGFWSGSPYLGHLGSLPPGEGGLNPWGGFTFPWHSHTEKELLNNDIFPGGMLTFVVVVPRSNPLP